MPHGFAKAQVARAGLVLALALASGGCVTRPKEINGHKVIGTRWVNGHIVYVLGESDADRQRMHESAQEADNAAKSVVFRPTRPKH